LLTFNVHSSSYEFYLASAAAAAWGVQNTYTLDFYFYFLLLSAAGIRKWHLSKWVRGAAGRKKRHACAPRILLPLYIFIPPATACCLPVIKLVLGC
jgi:hypothetical protein